MTRDLGKLATQTCSGLNLEEELKKKQLPSPPRTPPRNDRKHKIALSGPEAQKRLKEGVWLGVRIWSSHTFSILPPLSTSLLFLPPPTPSLPLASPPSPLLPHPPLYPFLPPSLIPPPSFPLSLSLLCSYSATHVTRAQEGLVSSEKAEYKSSPIYACGRLHVKGTHTHS